MWQPKLRGEYLSGQKGQTVNLVALAFTGSNPVSPNSDTSGRALCGVLSEAIPVEEKFSEVSSKLTDLFAGVVQW